MDENAVDRLVEMVRAAGADGVAVPVLASQFGLAPVQLREWVLSPALQARQIGLWSLPDGDVVYTRRHLLARLWDIDASSFGDDEQPVGVVPGGLIFAKNNDAVTAQELTDLMAEVAAGGDRSGRLRYGTVWSRNDGQQK